METETEIQTYRVDDIPLLVWQQRVMGIPQIIDEVIQPHGNRQGLSVGWTVAVWLSYILSQADHRLSYVESWATEQHQVLQKLIPAEVSIRDFTDDRLGDVLNYLSDDASWSAIEVELGQQIMQVYDLSQERVHVDSTSAALYHSPEGNPLLRYGQSKDHRPDLAQFKVIMSSLAPMGMPLATLVVPGNRADDGLYLPVIEQSRQVLQRRGLLYVGDSKMEALSIRAALAAGNDFYLVPLSKRVRKSSCCTTYWNRSGLRLRHLPTSTTQRPTYPIGGCWLVPSKQLVPKQLRLLTNRLRGTNGCSLSTRPTWPNAQSRDLNNACSERRINCWL